MSEPNMTPKIYPFQFSYEAWEMFMELEAIEDVTTGLIDHFVRKDGAKIYPVGVEVYEDGTATIRLELREEKDAQPTHNKQGMEYADPSTYELEPFPDKKK